MTTIQKRNGGMTDLLSTDFARLDDPIYAGMAYDSIIMDTIGLIGYWPASGLGGARDELTDRSGNGNHFTTRGGSAYTLQSDSEHNPSVRFDGASDYWTQVSNASLQITGTETTISTNQRGLTICAWVHPDILSGSQFIFDKAFYLLFIGADKAKFQVFDLGTTTTVTITSTTSLNVNSWNFLVAKYSEASGDLYISVNGVNELSAQSITAITTSAHALTMGARFDFTGKYDGGMGRTSLHASYLSGETLDRLWSYGRKYYRI